jgi:hypothetical protein
MSSHELVDQVAELRRAGRTPKEIARALGLKPAEVTLLIRAVAAMAPRREAPLAGCWVTGHWAHGLSVAGHPEWPGTPAPADVPQASDRNQPAPCGLSGVLVARDTGSRATVCGYLVDAWCLGVKDTIGPTGVDRRKLPEFVHRFFSTWSSPPIPAPLELARHLVFGAVDYARRLGFEPPPDFARGAALLGQWQGLSSDITFGLDGRPMYVHGPRDDARAVMATLRRTVGDGNFGYLTRPGTRPPG